MHVCSVNPDACVVVIGGEEAQREWKPSWKAALKGFVYVQAVQTRH